MGTNLPSVSGKSVTKPAALSLARWWLRIASVSSARYSSVSTSSLPSLASREGASRLSPQNPAPLPILIGARFRNGIGELHVTQLLDWLLERTHTWNTPVVM